MFSVSDFESLIDTFCVGVNKYDLDQDNTFPKCIYFKFLQKESFIYKVKSSWKSTITQLTNLLSFIAFSQESIKRIKADSVELPALKPLCFSCSNLLSLRYFMNFLSPFLLSNGSIFPYFFNSGQYHLFVCSCLHLLFGPILRMGCL